MTTLFYFALAVAITIVGLIALSAYLAGKGFPFGAILNSFKPMTDQEKLQKAIDEAAERLDRASTALRKSQEYVRQVERELAASGADINTLTAQIKKAVAENNDATAKKLIARLQREEEEFKGLETKLNAAIKDHEFYSETVDEERRSVLAARQEADSLNVRLELAQADAAYRNSGTPSEALANLRAKVQGAEIHSKYGRGRTEEDDFLDAGKESAIEDRLREFKSGS